MTAFSRRAARTGRLVRDILLAAAAVGGAACLVFALLAFTGGYSLMMFKTGSMSPTIPAGSVALVQRIPASEIVVGDVVTVDRAGTLPITHRVTSVGEGSVAAERVITMRGDANVVDDPMPYTLAEARIVRGSVPYLAPVIAQFGNPWVLGSLTLATAFLVGWAFWPRRPRTDDAEAPPPEPADAVDPPGDGESAGRAAAGARVLAALFVLAVCASSATLAPAPASAATGSDYLSVRSDLAGAGVQALDPLVPLRWHLDVDASAAPADGDLAIAISSVGDPAFGLRAEVRACGQPWLSDGTCPSGERLLRPEGPLPADGVWQDLLSTATPAVAYVQVALTAQPQSPEAGAAGASVTVRATAGGDTVDTGIDGESELPPTGGSGLALLAAPAAVLVGIGIALLARRRPSPRGRR
ncbi:S26 family signal peptidase [Microbacterium oxydans]|uniref:S26 family signal peptidase n=1 Tax=Microbacterium oxydans TaxID=82380 RepID=UPI001ABEEEF9|nr:S26 family signal peptidase [Microbacterium oxydans]